MTYNLDSLPSFNRIIFDKITKKAASSYLLDYVTKEYEAIISCPPISTYNYDYFSSSKRLKSDYKTTNRIMSTAAATGLPSPPLSSPERKSSSKYNQTFSCPPTPPSPNNAIPLRSYIESVVKKSKIDTGTLITSLSYARRLKSKLSHTSKGMECTHHRIFLATLIIASKYIHDSAFKNKYWVGYAQMFSASEINLMEKQLLQLLDYNLEIELEDYNIIVNDIVQVHFKNNYSKEFVTSSDWSNHNNLEDSDNNNVVYKETATNSLLNRFKPSPPLLSSL